MQSLLLASFLCVCPDTLHQAKTFRNKYFFCFARDVYIVVIVVAILDAVDYDQNDSRLKSTTHLTLVARINTFLPSLCTAQCTLLLFEYWTVYYAYENAPINKIYKLIRLLADGMQIEIDCRL